MKSIIIIVFILLNSILITGQADSSYGIFRGNLLLPLGDFGSERGGLAEIGL